MPSGYSFSQFSIILYTAMGWSGYHLSMHEFPTLGLSFAEESEDDDLWGEPKDLNAALYVIDEFLEQVKSYTYTYDFGDAVVKGGYIDHLQQMIEEERSKMTDAKTAVRELTLLLMYLTRFTEDEDFDTAKEFCAWKGYDFSAMDELEDAEYIQKRSRGAKSVWITEQGVEQAKKLMLRYGMLDWEKKETKK